MVGKAFFHYDSSQSAVSATNSVSTVITLVQLDYLPKGVGDILFLMLDADPASVCVALFPYVIF